jgi:hypothetical protein
MRLILLLAAVGLLTGCERAQTAGPASQPAGNAQTSAARIEPAAPPTTEPAERAPSIVMIDQKRVTFPPAILQVRNRDGQLTAILMSDDPKDAINDNYHGNSFYLEMPLEVTDLKDLPSDVYRYTSANSERTDSPNGIFLDGNRLQLQPADIQVKFEGDNSPMNVTLAGQFLQFETHDDTIAPKRVAVIARMDVDVKKK